MTIVPLVRPPAAPGSLPPVGSLVGTPSVVAHRGASGHRPEHTMAAYRLAIQLGVDDLEIDVVSTRDGVLVARHDAELTRTTDVATRPELAHLRTTKRIDGRILTGWFIEDLTLAQVRTLRARERFPAARWASAAYDGRDGIVTLDEVLGLIRGETRRRGRPVGLLVELKHAAYFAGLGLSLEAPLLDALRRHDLDHPASPVSVMSFETPVLRSLARVLRVPIVQLLDRDDPGHAELATPAGLRRLEDWADGIGAHQGLVLGAGPDGNPAPTDLVRDAHRVSLTVHVWTLRAENRFLAPRFRSRGGADAVGDLACQTSLLIELGVDGLITDHPGTVLGARDAALQSWGSSAHATR